MMVEVVGDRLGMLANMTPSLHEGEYVFCSIGNRQTDWLQLRPLGFFREAEGVALIIEALTARAAGLDVSLTMRQITLNVNSALDGVGLTAGVATALAEAGIPCNMVAAFHHDYIFVPVGMAAHAMQVLLSVQAQAKASATESSEAVRELLSPSTGN